MTTVSSAKVAVWVFAERGRSAVKMKYSAGPKTLGIPENTSNISGVIC